MSADTVAGLYGLELLYAEQPRIDKAALLKELRNRLGGVDSLVGEVLAYVCHDFPVTPQHGVSAAMIFIGVSDEPVDQASVGRALEQTWNWSGAGHVVPRCRYSVTLTDMLARELEPQRRWKLVREALGALITVTPPVAIHWMPAQKLVDPLVDLGDPLLPINARLFRVDGRIPGECVMDTRGLHLFGLTDLQCHFVGLEPDKVAAYLLDISAYLLEHGPVIDHGQTVAGVGQGEQWTCVREDALVGPARPVIGIRPSSHYAPR
jgi:Domain of unknown function (DUF4261)